MRDENGLLVYDEAFRRRLMTPKEIALSDDFVKKTSILIAQYERGEISKEEYNRLIEELTAKQTKAYGQLYDEEFVDKSVCEEKFFTPPNFATA